MFCEEGTESKMKLTDWERKLERHVRGIAGDAAHDFEHIRRVVLNAKRLAVRERGDPAVIVPAAWLHDCVTLPKTSPQRSQASRLAAAEAMNILRRMRYPARHLPAIRHAIEAHSFTAGIAPETREARIVQDADRLDAIGATGLSRCLMLGGATGRRLYDPAEPFPRRRKPDDLANTIDHFYTKLLRLEGMMQTRAGRAEARRRTQFLRTYLAELKREVPVS